MSLEIQRLLQGHREFRARYFQAGSRLFAELVQYGQRPQTMVITCADARVDPAVIFNCQPGELFIVRNIANLVPPCEAPDSYHGTSAALEFGVCFLEITELIILGHTQCGGIQALLQNAVQVLPQQSRGFIAKWLELAQPAYAQVQATHATATPTVRAQQCERAALVHSLHNLTTFPWLQERLQRGQLAIHAWHFELATGQVWRYEQNTGQWLGE